MKELCEWARRTNSSLRKSGHSAKGRRRKHACSVLKWSRRTDSLQRRAGTSPLSFMVILMCVGEQTSNFGVKIHRPV
ncbi:unnamed protein product [Penicillium roqueforti FM164]|uniref:Genomic scaffold, ProqFM164S03 n=1 Tax=Penicillium roqueforti (strain FM164) TaxID=1365484 RepID=W6QD02_PENRF|nr:unnamed protein product [Penicillium roqueforti FM164]